MCSFQDLTQKVKEFLAQIEDYCSDYYLELVNDELFCSFLERVFGGEEKEIVYCEALLSEYRLIDIENILSLMQAEPESGDDLYCIIPFQFVIPVVDTKEEKQICEPESPKSQAVINQRQELFYSVKLLVTEVCGCEEEYSVELCSNILNVSSLMEQFEQDIASLRFVALDETSYQVLIKSEPERFAIRKTIAQYTYVDVLNRVIVTGESNAVIEFFEYARLTVAEATKTIETINRLEKIKELLSIIPEIYKQVRIDKILEKNSAQGILTFDDLVKDDGYSLDFDFVSELYNELKSKKFELPSETLWSILKDLPPRELKIIKERFFNDRVETLEAVGSQFGITRERIRQVEKKALRKVANSHKILYTLYQQLYWLSPYKNFISLDTLKLLEIPRGCMHFLHRATNLFEWDDESEILIFEFGKSAVQECYRAIDLLPPSIRSDEMSFIIAKLFEQCNGLVTIEGIEFLVSKKYDKYGEVYSRNRIRLGTVFAFLLEMYYPNGLDIYDDECINFLRVKAREHFDGFELADKNRAIRARLQDFCIPVARGVWKLDRHEYLLSTELRNAILSYIDAYKISIVPISAVFSRFDEELSAIGITNKYYLQGQLKKFLSGKYAVNRDYIFKDDNTSMYSLIESYVKHSEKLISKQDILEAFPGVTEITIQQVAMATGVMNMNGYYVHIDNLNITEKENRDLYSAVASIVCEEEIYHVKNVYKSIQARMQGLFSRIGIEHYLQCYYLLHELYADQFEFCRPYMAKIGVEVMGGEEQVLAKMAKNEIVYFSEIREYAKAVGTIIDRYIEFVNRHSDAYIFMSHEAVISVEALELEENLFEELDNELERFLGDLSYRALNEFYDYWKLPKLTIPWNEWLLYSIINKYSEKFSTAVSSNVLSEAIPILTRGDVLEQDMDLSNIVKQEQVLTEDLLDLIDIDDLL